MRAPSQLPDRLASEASARLHGCRHMNWRPLALLLCAALLVIAAIAVVARLVGEPATEPVTIIRLQAGEDDAGRSAWQDRPGRRRGRAEHDRRPERRDPPPLTGTPMPSPPATGDPGGGQGGFAPPVDDDNDDPAGNDDPFDDDSDGGDDDDGIPEREGADDSEDVDDDDGI